MPFNNNHSIYEDMTPPETKVAIFLKQRGIRWNFEQPIYVADDKNRPRVWTPDFYLPELGVYVEVCGMKRMCYEYRKKIFDDNKIPVIFVQTYKKDRWQDYLFGELIKIQDQRMKLIEKMRSCESSLYILSN